MLHCVRLFATPWRLQSTGLFMGFSRQAYWSGLPFPTSEDLPDPGIEPVSLVLADGFFTTMAHGSQNAVRLVSK